MKKANRFLALLLSIVMAMSFTVVCSADTSEEKVATGGQEVPFGAGGLDLNPESIGVSEKLTVASETYSQTFTYTPQVDCYINFQINKNSKYDTHKNVGDYTILIKKNSQEVGNIEEEKLKNYFLEGKNKYSFIVTRDYLAKVNDVYVGITTKINPDAINGDSFNNTYFGDKNICKYYSFNPVNDGGYLFNLEPTSGCIGENKNYQINVYSKGGNSLNEFAEYIKGESNSMLRLYLKANTEYIIETQGYGETGLGYTFTMESVPVGPSIALVGAPALSLDNEVSCALYPFANRRAFAWYTFTAPKASSYEFVVNNKFDAKFTGDIQAEIKDDTFSPTEDNDILYVYENESGVLTRNMREGETCYIQIAEQYKGLLTDVYNVGLKVREHAHSKELFVDGDYVSYGCSCQLDEYIDYAYWFEGVNFGNATYTGKSVSPSPKFLFNVVLPDDGSFTPTIPESAYTISVISSNKKNIGKAKAKIKFTGAYKSLGSHTASFKIVPKGTELSKLSAVKSGFKANWKKQTKQTSGYELRYSVNGNMSGSKTVAIRGNKTVTKKASKLKSETKYYVQVRTFKTVSGKKYTSAWSKQLAITTK